MEEEKVENEVTASEPVETVTSETVCSNCDGKNDACIVCKKTTVE